MKRHLKRLAAPRAWRIPRKEKKWTVKTAPGPHRIEKSIPLLLVLRDLLNHARTSREARKIINGGKVMVDKKVREDYKFPVGLMDVLEIPESKERWIVLFDKHGKIKLNKLTIKRAKNKLCKLLNKTIVKGGKVQLNLHDGRNILIDPKDDIYKTKDSLLIDLKKKSIVGHVPFKEGSKALVTGGKHISKIAEIKEFRVNRGPGANTVVLKDGEEEFETIEDYVFVVGEEKLAIPEVAK